MIFFKNEDIFNADQYWITCPVNLVGVMGAGLALEFARRAPHVEGTYKGFCAHGFPFGEIRLIDHDSQLNKGVVLLATKNHFREIANLDLIDKSLSDLYMKIKKGLIKSDIAMPQIGAGLGKLSFCNDVYPLISKYFEHTDIIDIYIYKGVN